MSKLLEDFYMKVLMCKVNMEFYACINHLRWADAAVAANV